MKQGHNKVVELVIISGRSGAGKTVALHSLEDLGYYCVDNLPVVMLEDIVKLAKTTYPKLAVSIDVRNMPLSEEDLQKLNDSYVKTFRDPDINSTVIFIDADDQVLIEVDVKYHGVVVCLICKEIGYGRQHGRSQQLSEPYCPVVIACHLHACVVEDVEDDEYQYGYDDGYTQSALTDDGTQWCSDEEEDEA